MKKIILASLVCLSMQTYAQKYFTKTGTIIFNTKSPVEKIEGVNKSVGCLLDSKTGDLNFTVLIKSFVFEKQLLQEHFNENYMESDKFPKSSFKGKITNIAAINFSQDGVYEAQVTGVLQIHGVDKQVSYKGKVIVKAGKISLSSNLGVLLSDYKIAIPAAVKDKLSNDVTITVNVALDKMN